MELLDLHALFSTIEMSLISAALYTVAALAVWVCYRKWMCGCSGCPADSSGDCSLPRVGDPTLELETAQLERELEAKYRDIFPCPPVAPDQASWRESAARLSQLIKADYLRPSALNSRRFFAAHRVLAKLSEGSLGIRLTCHFNLFVGTVAALGSDSQQAWIEEVHARGELGCFLLTESSAGVLSGLVVHTTATWDSESKAIVLNTPVPLRCSERVCV